MKKLVFLLFPMFGTVWVHAQNLFLEECFVGGVTVAGRTSLSFIDGHTKIKWEDDYTLKAAYAMTYRWGRPQTKPFTVNNVDFEWDYTFQIGLEQPEEIVNFFAVHVQEITKEIELFGDSISIFMNAYDPNTPIAAGQGWWSLSFAFLYTSPNMTDTTCFRIYTASQRQDATQIYGFATPRYKSTTDVGFAIYSDRVGGAIWGNPFEDHTRITINDSLLGYNSVLNKMREA